jgi:hypothetical protein
MIDTDELDKKTLREKWEVITESATCPYPLLPFVGSRLLDEQHPEDDPRATALLVELKPGVAHSAVAHLTDALASFLDLPRESVYIERNVARARRVEITIVSPADEA